MDERKIDLASLRIDRHGDSIAVPRRSKAVRKTALALAGIAAIVIAVLIATNLLNPAIEVQLATASMNSPAQATAVLTASGYVVARRKAAVASKGTGRLIYLGVEEGDWVKKGQVIARLEDEDVLAALRRARADLQAAQAELNDARESLNRQRELRKKDFVAQAEYDAAEARYKRVLATIEAAKFAVAEAEVAVENTRIIAPFDGTVLRKNADIGEIVAPLAGATSSRAAVVTIADMSSLEVDADVSEANITRVQPDQLCEIRLDAYPDRPYLGYVSKIVPTADRAKATVMVKIRFKDYDKRVLPEMSAKVSFLPQGTADPANMRPVLTVPASAVTMREGRPVVYQVSEERAVEIPVGTGRQLGDWLEIKSGLKEGERVIAKVDDRIHAGSKVMVKRQ